MCMHVYIYSRQVINIQSGNYKTQYTVLQAYSDEDVGDVHASISITGVCHKILLSTM